METVVEQVSVDVPGVPVNSETNVGLSEQVGPEGETEADSVTVPVKLLMPVTVTIDVPESPGWIDSDAGFATMLKSVTTTEITTEWDAEPLLPVTVTV